MGGEWSERHTPSAQALGGHRGRDRKRDDSHRRARGPGRSRRSCGRRQRREHLLGCRMPNRSGFLLRVLPSSIVAVKGRMRRPYVSRNQHRRVLHLLLHPQRRLHVRPAAAVPVLPGGGVKRPHPEVGCGRFGPSLCHFHPLALVLHPSGWGLASSSGTIA
jgi:hypothetical protein